MSAEPGEGVPQASAQKPMSVGSLLRDIVNRSMDDHVGDQAACLAYYLLFSLFPLLLFLAALTGPLHLGGMVAGIVRALQRSLPHETAQLLGAQIVTILQKRHNSLLSVGSLLLLYSASQAFSGLMTALNAAYEVPETRSFAKRLCVALGLTFSAGAFMILALGALIVGQRMLYVVADPIHLRGWLPVVWPVVRWSMVALSLFAALVLLYRTAPNITLEHGASYGFMPAAGIALLLWLGASVGLGVYFNHFSNYDAVYGSLGAVIGLMLWFYVLSLALLLGAEVHAALLRAHGLLHAVERRRPESERAA